VSKHFSGVYALKHVSLEIFPGQVTALIGENGAGKSTLMKIVSGVYTDYEGELYYQDQQVRFSNPKEAADSGVVIIHQELNLIPHLSVADNLFLGNEILNRLGMLDKSAMNARAQELLHQLHLDVHPDTPLHQLRVGQQQLVEIARALLLESKVLIMDEPTSAISDHEVKLLFRIIAGLKERGVAIVYISHKLNELFQIADAFAVLRDGENAGSGMMSEVDREQLVQKMVGRKLTGSCRNGHCVGYEELLRVENLCLKNPENREGYLVNDINFTLRRGEVLGICGLMGAGRTEVLEAIFGLYPKLTSGRIFISGKEMHLRDVSDAIAAGIALVPEDRKLQGLILNMSVPQNTSMANIGRIVKFGFLSKKKELELSNSFVQRLNTRISSEEQEVEKLSGGNQQKVVIAKWLATNPAILLLDEPTRGIDIGAKSEIYKLINELSEQGLGIVMVSSELPEILAVSDTVLVMSESKQTAIMPCSEATEAIIMKAALAEKA
jgi:ribose transport system ATP-binding protein